MEAEDQAEVSPENTPVSDVPAPPPTVLGNTPDNSHAQEAVIDTPVPNIDPASLPPPGSTAPLPAPESVPTVPQKTESTTLPPIPHPHSFHGPASHGQTKDGMLPPLTLNQLAIATASQNKLPTSRVKGIVTRMGRHTQASAGKLGRWYKGDNYVDTANYSWRNMELFVDYQKQMYTRVGTVKASCKK